jgi:hypothetical protein
MTKMTCLTRLGRDSWIGLSKLIRASKKTKISIGIELSNIKNWGSSFPTNWKS